MSGSGIPAAFFPILKQFSEFSRKKIKVNTISRDSCNPGDLLQLTLPEGKLDMTTFAVGGLLTTTTSAGHATVGNVDQLIEQVMVEVK